MSSENSSVAQIGDRDIKVETKVKSKKGIARFFSEAVAVLLSFIIFGVPFTL